MTGKNNLKHVENSGIFYMKNLLNSTYHCTFRSFFGIIEVEKTLVKEGLEMQNIESLRKENEALKTELQASEIRVVGLTKLNQWYIEQLKLSRQKKFGASSEKSEHDSEQISFFNEAEATVADAPFTAEPSEETIVAKPKNKRGASFDKLDVETIEYKLDAMDETCKECGNPLHMMKKEVRKELKFIPAQFKIVEHVTYVYACRNCEEKGIKGNIVTATTLKALLPKSFASASVISHVMYQKYVNAMPLDRQEKDYKRLGVSISKQNLSNWVIKGAKLLEPLQTEMKKELLKNQNLHADETVLEVLNEPGREATSNSYMWLYRTSGDTNRHVVLYDYTQGRSGSYANKYLSGFHGYLHTDGYAGYHQLEPELCLCGCWAHARRKFDEALKVISSEKKSTSLEARGLLILGKLFKVEETIKDFTALEKHKIRTTESQQIIKEFYDYIEANDNRVLPQSLLGKAYTYAKNQKKYLLSFLKDGRIELSNNRAERSIKPFVIGRKNWLFSNTPSGAKSSAIIYSIVQTAMENGLQPQAYLQYVFEQIQLGYVDDFQKLLPWADNIPELCKMKSE